MAIELTDDGTFDTVLRCSDCGEEFRYNYDHDPFGTEERAEEIKAELPDYPPLTAAQIEASVNETLYDEFVTWAIEDATNDHECPAHADEPDEDAITTSDHETFYQYGDKVLERGAKDEWWFDKQTSGIRCNSLLGTFGDYRAALRAYMDRVQFWPDVWFISDHGNAHRIDLTEQE